MVNFVVVFVVVQFSIFGQVPEKRTCPSRAAQSQSHMAWHPIFHPSFEFKHLRTISLAYEREKKWGGGDIVHRIEGIYLSLLGKAQHSFDGRHGWLRDRKKTGY